MNTYFKIEANVFLAKCETPHNKGDIIEMTTQRGKTHEVIVFNLYAHKGEYYYYSVVRADGFNFQEYAKKRAEKFNRYAESANRRAEEFFEKSQKDMDFLSLGEPIKIGHHSEKRHRKAIDDMDKNMRHLLEMKELEENHKQKAEYWENLENEIKLSMPESLEFYEIAAQEAAEYHLKLKSGEIPREHCFSLQYAKKRANETARKYELAKKLWA